jgi:DNA-binding transcriptional MerR regulator
MEIPDKLYFKIGEVASITGLPGYVLRFWESEFKTIRPTRSESGQRLYRRKDLEEILQIRDLLYNQKFTIKGAKKHLNSRKKDTPAPSPLLEIKEIREELKKIRNMLD